MQRDISIDALKGVGIILVLVAHSLGGYIGTFSYSFHMPLFFLVSGYFYKPRGMAEEVRHDFSRLMIPFLFAYAVVLAFAYGTELLGYARLDGNVIVRDLSRGATIGNLWFLLALFWAKILFNAVMRVGQRWAFGLCLLIGSVAYIMGQYVHQHYMLLAGMAVLPFLWIGWKARQTRFLEGPVNWWLLVPLAAIWLYTTKEHSLGIGGLYFRYLYVGNLVTATVGTYVIYLLCKWLCDSRKLLMGGAGFLLYGQD